MVRDKVVPLAPQDDRDRKDHQAPPERKEFL